MRPLHLKFIFCTLLAVVLLPSRAQITNPDPENALNFSGGTVSYDDVVVINPIPNYLQGFSSFDYSFEAWLKPETIGTSTPGNNDHIYHLQSLSTYITSLSFTPTGELYFLAKIQGVDHEFQSNVPLPTNQWSHVAITWDASARIAKIYINGIDVTQNVNYPLIPSASNGNLVIGGFLYAGQGTRLFDGDMDELRFWQKVLDPCEVAANMHSKMTGSEPDLYLYYEFDEGIPNGNNPGITTVPDITGNGFDGTLQDFGLMAGTESNWVNSGASLLTTGFQSVVYTTISPTGCNSYTSPSGNYIWTSSGTYMDTVALTGGCDNIYTIHLTVNQPTSTTIYVTTCTQFVSPSGNYTWTSGGTYMDTIPNAVGCDSVITVILTITYLPNSAATISPIACDSYTSPSGNYTWSASGTYMDTILNNAGCDSIITINLTVINFTSDTINVEACGSYTSPSGNYTWITSGTYMDTIPNNAGCDSIIPVNLTVSTSILNVPQIEWEIGLGGRGYEASRAVLQDSDGNYVVAGNPDGFGYQITKLDDNGNIIWNKFYGDSGLDIAYAILQTTDGGYIVAGQAYSNGGPDKTVDHGWGDYWIIKLDASGNLQWEKSYGGSDDDIAYSIDQTFDGGYIIAGETYSNDGQVSNPTAQTTMWVVKVDSLGTMMWEKSFGGSMHESAATVRQYSDGNYFVFGYTESTDGDVSGSHGGGADYWLIKLDTLGNVLWEKTYGGSIYDKGTCMDLTTDGGLILGGYSSSNDGDVSGVHNPGSLQFDYWMVKVDAVGNVQWGKALGGSLEELAYSIKQTADGGYVMAGVAESSDGDLALATNNFGGWDYWVVKVDPTGNLEWLEIFGGSFTNIAYSIIQSADGDYVFVGEGGSNSVNDDNYVAKFSLTCLATDTTIYATICDSYYTSPSGNYTWTTSGTYMDTIQNSTCCDSIITIHLNINQSTSATAYVTTCSQYVSPSGNYTWTASGTYMDTIPNAAGCDSVITINLTIISAPIVSGSGTFNNAVNYLAGDGPFSVSTADFDGDGAMDLAVANFPNDRVSVLLGDGNGSFAAPVNYAVPSRATSVTTADFNSDGAIDMAVTNYFSDNVSILLGNGNGTFANAVNYATGTVPLNASTGDFNSDGNIDLAVVNMNSNNISILLGNGNGTFAAATNYPVGSSPRNISVADFNGDLIEDLVISNWLSNSFSIYLGNGNGTFTAGSSKTLSTGVYNTEPGDYNNDGLVDLAVVGPDFHIVAITTGNGDGTFTLASSFGTGNRPLGIISGDFNGDGLADLATNNQNSDDISVFLGYGNSTFGAAVNYPVGDLPRHLVSADFNGDGLADIAVANETSDNVSILLGLGTAPSSSTINAVACDTYTSPSGNYTWTTSGTYMDTIPNAYGCDSIITINLTVNYSTQITISPVACDSYISPTGNTYSSSGTYTEVLPNATGCDTILTINLTVHPDNLTTSTLSLDVDCGWGAGGAEVFASGYAPGGPPTFLWSNGATTSAIGPIATGFYFVTTTDYAGCTEVDTFDITTSSFHQINANIDTCERTAVVEVTGYGSLTDVYFAWNTGDTTPQTWNGVSHSGTNYSVTVTDEWGCFDVVNETISLPENRFLISPTACYSYTSPSGNYTWNTSGTFRDTIPGVTGCDSIFTIYLTINNTSSIHYQVVCDAYTSPSGNYTWTTSGTYMDTIPNANGCDSIITINLTVKSSTSRTINPITCNSYTSPSSNYTWTTSGAYMDTIPNAVGCDSVITINLTINAANPSIVCPTNINVSSDAGICGAVVTYINPTTSGFCSTPTFNLIAGLSSGATFPIGTTTIILEAVDTYGNADTCSFTIAVVDNVPPDAQCKDYSVVLDAGGNASIFAPDVNNGSNDPCGLLSMSVFPFTFSCANIGTNTVTLSVTDNYINTATCIATVTVVDADSPNISCPADINVNASGGQCSAVVNYSLPTYSDNCGSTSIIQTAGLPSGSSFPAGTTINTFEVTDAGGNMASCSFTVTVIGGNTYATINPLVCDSYTSPSGNFTWTTSGTYMDTILNNPGCDSVITINLTINNSTSTTLNEVACDSYTSPAGNNYTTSGTYNEVLNNAAGCDSLVTINLTVNYSSTSTISPVVCNSYTSPAGNTYTTSGNYTDVIPNATGCDSVITINLTVNTNTTAAIYPVACGSYTSPSGNYTWTQSGIFLDTIPNTAGCDSTLKINLTVNPLITFYADADADGYGNANISIEDCNPPSGYVNNSLDCDDNNGTFYPGAPELCDGEDNNCDGNADEGLATTISFTTNPLTHLGSGSSSTTVVLNPVGNDPSFTITGLDATTNGKPNNRYIESISVSYTDGNGQIQNYGTFSGESVASVNIFITGTVQSITVSLSDIYNGNTSTTLSVLLGNIDYCGGPACPDADGDNVCDADDVCPGFDDHLIGTACNDGDACTINDVYTISCNCEGSPTGDSDNDGVCDALDICPGGDDNIDTDNDGIPDFCDNGNCTEILSDFSPNPLTHTGNGSSASTVLLGSHTDVSFTISGIDAKINGKESRKYIEEVTVTYVDGASQFVTEGVYRGDLVSSANINIPGIVQSVSVSITDVYDGSTESTMQVAMSQVTSCAIGSKTSGLSVDLEESILKAYPNPFSGSTNIEFTMANTGRVALDVYDIKGAKIAQLFEGEVEELESQKLYFDATALSQNLYILRLTSATEVRYLKLFLVK